MPENIQGIYMQFFRIVKTFKKKFKFKNKVKMFYYLIIELYFFCVETLRFKRLTPLCLSLHKT